MAIVKCRECNADISSEAKSCPQCGCPRKERKPIPKKIITIGVIFVVVIAAIVAIISSANAWKNTFDVVYKEYDYKYSLSPSYVYEITNKSDRTTQNVYAIIEVEAALKTFKFENYVGDIKPGETDKYKLSTTAIKNAAEDCGIDTESATFWISNVDIVGFRWE